MVLLIGKNKKPEVTFGEGGGQWRWEAQHPVEPDLEDSATKASLLAGNGDLCPANIV